MFHDRGTPKPRTLLFYLLLEYRIIELTGYQCKYCGLESFLYFFNKRVVKIGLARDIQAKQDGHD